MYGIIFILQALVSVQNTKLTKEMNFKLQLYMQLPATITGAVAGIWFANKGYGAWSLVYMNLIRTTVFMAQHWIFTDWKPVFIFDKELLRKHFSFGYKLTIIGIINTIYNNIYDIIIGKITPKGESDPSPEEKLLRAIFGDKGFAGAPAFIVDGASDHFLAGA